MLEKTWQIFELQNVLGKWGFRFFRFELNENMDQTSFRSWV